MQQYNLNKKNFIIIIIMHFISGSKAHKNTASEKTRDRLKKHTNTQIK